MGSHYDIVIVGGGLAGCCLAYALKDLPFRVALIESRDLSVIANQNDNRAIALTYGSQQYLKRLGLWDKLACFAEPIKRVHVSDKGHFGIAAFDAAEFTLPALGYVLPFNILQDNFQQVVATCGNVTIIASTVVTAVEKVAEQWQMTVKAKEEEYIVSSRLLIAADGNQSTVRKLHHIPVKVKDYQQTAVISHLQLQRSHQGIAYERFTAEGAIALLPYNKQHAALIWSVNSSFAKQVLAWDDAYFLKKVQAEFGYRAGRFLSATQRLSYPLKMMCAQPNDNDAVLIGNALHVVHPIAAQGFNLGIRDIAELVALLQQVVTEKQVLEMVSVNQRFLQNRLTDYQRTTSFTDNLTRLFGHDFFPLNVARNVGLSCLGFLPLLKRKFLRGLLGFV